MSESQCSLSKESLHQVLLAFDRRLVDGVNLEVFKGWGTNGAKRIQDLFEEIQAKESQLVIDSRGISRVLHVVRMMIEDDKLGTLAQVKTVLPDGQERHSCRWPSGKIAADEDPEAALKREMEEELELASNWYSYQSFPVIVEETPSKSYPGLRCVYHIHPFRIKIVEEIVALLGHTHTTYEKNGTVLHFKWIMDFKQNR